MNKKELSLLLIIFDGLIFGDELRYSISRGEKKMPARLLPCILFHIVALHVFLSYSKQLTPGKKQRINAINSRYLLGDEIGDLFNNSTKGIGCLRFAFMDDEGSNGLGHRVMDLALLLEFAERLNAIPVLGDRHFSSDGHHGDYTWFPGFAGHLQLPNEKLLLHMVPDLRTITVHNWDHADYGELQDECYVIFHTCDFCCESKNGKKGYCTDKHRPFPEAVNRLASLMRPAFESTVWGAAHRHVTLSTPATATKTVATAAASAATDVPACVSIVVHVRVGDLTLGCGMHGADTVPTAADQVYDVLQILGDLPCVDVQYLSELPLDEDCLDALSSRQQHMQRADATGLLIVRNIVEPSVMHSLWQMLIADILIGSGSAFPFVAAIMSRWLVYVATLPKEGSYAISTVFDEIRYEPPMKFSRPDTTITNDTMNSVPLTTEEARQYMCDRIAQRRGVELCAREVHL